MKKNLFVLLCVALLIAACLPAQEPTPSVDEIVQATFQALTLQAPTQATVGSISGNLSFPSEVIPPLLVVAFNNETGQYYWTQTTENQQTYQIDNLPVGKYYVFAYLLPDGSMVGSYDQFYVCGLSVECTNISLIEVDVQAGAVTPNINPGNWYGDDSKSPPMPNDPSIPNLGVGGESAPVETGSVTGQLSYPSNFIPAQVVVAFSADTQSYYYVITAQNQSSYQIDNLPSGAYYIVAYLTDGSLSAGYTRAVACGLTAECTDHNLVSVFVPSGEVITDVNPQDWYADPDSFPEFPLP